MAIGNIFHVVVFSRPFANMQNVVRSILNSRSFLFRFVHVRVCMCVYLHTEILTVWKQILVNSQMERRFSWTRAFPFCIFHPLRILARDRQTQRAKFVPTDSCIFHTESCSTFHIPKAKMPRCIAAFIRVFGMCLVLVFPSIFLFLCKYNSVSILSRATIFGAHVKIYEFN